MEVEPRRLKLGGSSGDGDAAAVEDDDIVGDAEDELGTLLDQDRKSVV